MKSLRGDGFTPALPVVPSRRGLSGLVVRRYPAAPPPPTFQTVPVLSRSVSWLTRNASLFDAADSNFPSERGAVGFDRSTTSTWSPPSIHASEQSAFTKLAMCPDPRPFPVRPRGMTASTLGDVGSAMLTTYIR